MQKQEDNNSKAWVKYLVAAVSGLVFAFIICVWKGIFHTTETKEVVRILSDGATFSGLMLACFGILTVLNKAGAFDGLAYSFKYTLRVWRNYRKDDTPKSYYEYQQEARKKRKRAWYLVIVGGGYLVIAAVLVIIYSTMG